MAKGKIITIFLIDGEANGKIKASIKNWNGVAYKIPRELLEECKELDAFKQSGVYFLFGDKRVYVGQAEVRKNGKGIHQRIVDHESDKYKDVWDEVVIFTTTDNTLGKTEISYLENRFYNKAMVAKRYSVQNGQEPTIGTVTEEKEIEMEEFIDQAELILGALGYKVFEPYSDVEKKVNANRPQMPLDTIPKVKVPDLPQGIDKIGEYVQTALRNLQESGYIFSDEQMADLLDGKRCKEIFNFQSGEEVAFFKIFNENDEKPQIVNGYQRYYSPNVKTGKNIYCFGRYKLLFTKEWFPEEKYHQRTKFDEWYKGL